MTVGESDPAQAELQRVRELAAAHAPQLAAQLKDLDLRLIAITREVDALTALAASSRTMIEALSAPAISREVEREPAPDVNGRPKAADADQAARIDRDQEQTVAKGSCSDRDRAARLIALPMAVAGSTRAEVERHLRQVNGLDDPTAVLDYVFGTTHAGY